MKTNIKLVAGGVSGLLACAGLLIAFFVWAGSTPEPTPAAEANVPVPSPSFETGLATTATEAAPPAVAPVVEDAPEPILPADPFAPTMDESGSVRVRRLILSTGVEGHEPTGAADEFEIGAQRRIYAFVDAVNESDENAALQVTFEPELGETAGHVSLDVPSNARRWRTWAYTRHVYTPGRWNVVVRAADGHEVARRAFDVTE